MQNLNRVEQLLQAEATLVDFKEDLEEKKSKSWLKSVSACFYAFNDYTVLQLK